jgi:hypothetical protein
MIVMCNCNRNAIAVVLKGKSKLFTGYPLELQVSPTVAPQHRLTSHILEEGYISHKHFTESRL